MNNSEELKAKYTLTVTASDHGTHCIYLNDTRICGPKPWGGGKILHEFKVSIEDLMSAIPVVKKSFTTQETAELRAQIATLTQQSIDQALLVDRYEAAVKAMVVAVEEHTGVDHFTPFVEAGIATIRNTQPTIGVKVLELAKLGYSELSSHESLLNGEAKALLASITPEELKILGVRLDE